MRLVKQYGSYKESVFYRERSRQFRLHFVFRPVQRISRNYLKWNAQLGKEAKIRGAAVVRADADSQQRMTQLNSISRGVPGSSRCFSCNLSCTDEVLPAILIT